jgi:hypothetical protein
VAIGSQKTLEGEAMSERGYFEQFLFNPLSFEPEDVAKSHEEALKSPKPEEESIFLLVQGFLMYADQHRTDFYSVGKDLTSIGKAIQGLSGHGRLRKESINSYIQQVLDAIKSDTNE